MQALTAVLSARPAAALGRGLLRRRASVFMLHRLRSADRTHGHTVQEVQSTIAALRGTGARFKSLSDLVGDMRSGTDEGHAVAFTIDDGFADQADLARAFIAEGVPVTVFLVTGFLDGELWPWDDQVAWILQRCSKAIDVSSPDGPLHYDLTSPQGCRHAIEDYRNRLKTWPQRSLQEMLQPLQVATGIQAPVEPPPEHQPLTWDTVRALEAEGVEFAAHSRTHRIFSRLDDATAASEISASLTRIRHETRKALPLFAWPTGRASDFTARDIVLLRNEGVIGCVATDDDYAHFAAAGGQDDALYGLKRFSLPHTMHHTLQYGTWVERIKQLVRGQP